MGGQTPSAAARFRVTKVRCWVDNSAIFFIINSKVTASDEPMPELHFFNELLQCKSLIIDVRWIWSAENSFTDRLSRTLCSTAPQCTRSVIALLSDTLSPLVGRGTVLRYRLSGKGSTRWRRRSRRSRH